MGHNLNRIDLFSLLTFINGKIFLTTYIKYTHMKRTILMAALISIFAITSSYAQQGPPGNRGDGKARMERMNALYDELGLNTEQKDKLKVLNEEGWKKMQEIRNDESLSDEQRRAKMDEYRKDQKAKRDAILTPEQAKKLDEKMQEMRKNRQQ